MIAKKGIDDTFIRGGNYWNEGQSWAPALWTRKDYVYWFKFTIDLIGKHSGNKIVERVRDI